MKKIIRLTESDLYRIIKRVINEQDQNITFDDLQYYFEEVNDSDESSDQPIFIRKDTREVFILSEEDPNKKSKLKKLLSLIPKKEDIGFDNQNKPNRSLIEGNILCRIFDNNATEVKNAPYTKEALPIDIVFIDDYDNKPKRGKIPIFSSPEKIFDIEEARTI